MSRPSLLPALRARSRELSAESMPLAARNRVAAHLAVQAHARAGARSLRRWIPMVTFAAGAALVLLVVGWNFVGDRSPQRMAAAHRVASTLAGYTVAGSECTTARDGEAAALTGECRLSGPHLTVQTWAEARLVPRPRSVTMLAGEALFDVAPVGAGEASIRVFVSHGTIEVLGTRFTVVQTEGGGAVDLFEGKIRFRPSDPAGVVVEVRPGQRHTWGEQAVAADANREVDEEIVIFGDGAGDATQAQPPPDRIATDPSLAPRRSAAPSTRVARSRRADKAARDPEPTISRVSELRAAGRYLEAVGVLRRALRLRWEPRTAQVLSYELGQLLERHTRDPDAACTHWREHQARFPSGRYAGAVADSLRACPTGS